MAGVDQPTLLVTLTGPDRPGVTSTLFDRISSSAAANGADAYPLARTTISARESHPSKSGRMRGRAAVAVLGAPITATHLAAVSKAIAEHGANIDRIRRLSRFPVTTIELDVSGADLLRLRRELALVSSEHKVDIAVARSGLARRGRRLVVMDVDSTLIHEEVIELLARHAGRDVEHVAKHAAAAQLLLQRLFEPPGVAGRVVAAVGDEHAFGHAHRAPPRRAIGCAIGWAIGCGMAAAGAEPGSLGEGDGMGLADVRQLRSAAV